MNALKVVIALAWSAGGLFTLHAVFQGRSGPGGEARAAAPAWHATGSEHVPSAKTIGAQCQLPPGTAVFVVPGWAGDAP